MSGAIDDDHAQAGAAVAQKLHTHESAGAAREPGAVERRDAVVMSEGARPAHELVAGAGPADHLERVVVARRIDEWGGAGERAVERGTHPPVGRARDVLARDPALPGHRIHRADEGERNPEPRLEVSQREDVILPPEVPAVGAAAHQRMVGDDDHAARAGRAQRGSNGIDYLSPRVGGTRRTRRLRLWASLEPPLGVA